MTMFYFDVTLRVVHDGRPKEVSVYRGTRAADELSARRTVLNRFFEDGLQVLRLTRAVERSRD